MNFVVSAFVGGVDDESSLCAKNKVILVEKKGEFSYSVNN